MPDDGAENRTSSLLRTLLLCDLVESTALVERLGDREAAELIRKHDRLARTLADRHGGREIDKTDGFMMMFERPVQAVAFALDYQRGLRQLNAAENTSLSARVGIHVGDVVVWDNSSDDIARGAKPVEVEGLVKPVTSRLMNLALPGQILLSNIAYDLAHRAQGELGDFLATTRWRTHGRYRFRGVPDPVAVFEVGEEGLAPLKAPPWSSKAHREVPFWRRPATVVIETVVLVALIVVPAVMFLKPDPAIAFAKRDWVVVGSLHNLTSESLFDDALESALRIGLEQSHFVNVLPDLKVRDTIKRMQRDPDTTEIDRKVGSEVAIRDGARALILPTIAEIGGRVRITAEVIDPQTQTTVYSETADGIGKESILPSLDTINERLRVRLGEALATVSNESKPLEEVATKDLDALKAYSLGVQKASRGQFAEGLALLEQALKVDPQFASASIRVAIVNYSTGHIVEARNAFTQALENRSRLSARDTLYAESFLATMAQSSDALGKWQVLVDTYPDYFIATGGFAYISWIEANRFDANTISLALSAASTKNPTPIPSRHVLAILYLGNERYKEAAQVLKEAEADGLKFTHYLAATEAAQRRFDEAEKTLARMPAIPMAENPAAGSARTILEVAFLLDQGRIADATSALAGASGQFADASNFRNQFDVMGLSIRSVLELSDTASTTAAIESAIEQTKTLRATAAPTELMVLDARQSLLAYLAARTAQPALAKKALATMGDEGHPVHTTAYKLRSIAEAEIARKSGQPQQAIKQLEKLLDGSELYITHAALEDAYTQDGERDSDALKESEWLSAHRGRAYAEAGAEKLLSPLNVLLSDLSLLSGAELAIKNKNPERAASMLGKFIEVWPENSRAPPFAARVKKIQDSLAPVKSR
ncbi:MAG: putative peptide modification system cyclase [Xanthomonadales bacterium]|nr:putative peptide modification system cyclase [Xanthomonadales bacterium]